MACSPDICAYEAGTEGTSNFTDFVMNASTNPIDNTQVDPRQYILTATFDL